MPLDRLPAAPSSRRANEGGWGCRAVAATLANWLPRRYPTLHRPYRVPLPVWACALMLLPAVVLLMCLLVGPFVQGKMPVIVFTLAACLLGGVLHPLFQTARSRGWVAFRGTSPRQFREVLYNMYTPSADGVAAADP